jgi:hypothetical protein
VYKEVFNLGLFVTENILDLQGKDNQLTETEHMAICQHHCKSKESQNKIKITRTKKPNELNLVGKSLGARKPKALSMIAKVGEQ